MDRFFDMNNGIFHALSKFWDCVYLSILFLLSCIPIFTIGAAAAALYYTVQKVLKNNRGYVGKEYRDSLKNNLKQGTVLWLLILVMSSVLLWDIWYFWSLHKIGNLWGMCYLFFCGMMLLMLTWCNYLFSYLARFTGSTKNVMKNAAYMAVLHLPETLFLLVNLIFFGWLLYVMPMLLVIAPVAYVWIESLILEKVFRNYMSEEDRIAENERNQEYKN